MLKALVNAFQGQSKSSHLVSQNELEAPIFASALWLGSCLSTWLFQHFKRKAYEKNIERFSIKRSASKSSLSELEEKKVLVCTRIHGSQSLVNALENGLLYDFIMHTMNYADHILICIGCKTLEELNLYVDRFNGFIQKNNFESLIILHPVYPWGYFTTALNSAILVAQDRRCHHIAFQSLEFLCDKRVVRRLLRFMQDPYVGKDILMIGPVMSGHDFHPGENELRGRTCPWNTFAIWDVSKISLLGFPLLGDGVPGDRASGGVEEVSTVAWLQSLKPKWKAILVQFPRYESEWRSDFIDPERLAWHEKKMLSKDSRPKLQLEFLTFGLKHAATKGKVLHIIDES